MFSVGLDQPASIEIAIQAKARGRRVGHACKRESPKLRHKRRCTRIVTFATLTRAAHAGLNRVAFTGRVRGRPLKPGRYQAVFTASNANGSSPPRALNFKIVKR